MTASNPFTSFMQKWNGETVSAEQLSQEANRKLKIFAEKRAEETDDDEDDGESHAHKSSIYNREEIKDSHICGCFSCLSIYPPSDITDWCDQEDETAICPKCGIDAVLGDASGYPITLAFLTEMKERWF
mgnify:CR=1 FL=1